MMGQGLLDGGTKLIRAGKHSRMVKFRGCSRSRPDSVAPESFALTELHVSRLPPLAQLPSLTDGERRAAMLEEPRRRWADAVLWDTAPCLRVVVRGIDTVHIPRIDVPVVKEPRKWTLSSGRTG